MEDVIANDKWFEELSQTQQAIESLDIVESEEILEEPSIVFDLSTLLKKEFPPVSWRVDKLVPDCGLVAISGLPGSGKSWITEHLALAVASGTPLFGKFETQEGSVLIIDKENNISLIQKRFKLLGGLEGLGVYFLNREFFVEEDQLIEEIVSLIQKLKIKLVIVDSLIRIYRNKDENSSNDMAEVFRQLKRFQEVGAAVVFTHHHRKQSIMAKNVASESMRGSSDILAAVDCHLAVDKTEDGIKITQTKLRQEMSIKPFKINLEGEGEHLDLVFIGEVEEEREKMEEAKVDIYEAFEEGEISRADLINRFRGVYGTKTIDNALKAFTEEEVVVRVGERGKKFYRRVGTEPEGSLLESVSQNSSTYI